MKIFFDTNVYVAEALLGEMAEQLLAATHKAGWRIFCSSYVLEELERVLTETLGFSRRLGSLSRRRVLHKARLVNPGASRHEVIKDINDSPILKAALEAVPIIS
jgi:predicted nucleic acid-binding protein